MKVTFLGHACHLVEMDAWSREGGLERGAIRGQAAAPVVYVLQAVFP